MITANAGPLVPDWVWRDSFPQADETRLAKLAESWTAYVAAAAESSRQLAGIFEEMDAHAGPGADATATKAASVRGWLGTICEAAESLAETATVGGLLVTRAKRSINVVLAGLQLGISELLMSLATGPPVDQESTLLRVRQLHLAAQAYCRAIAVALTDELGLLAPEVNDRLLSDPGHTAPDETIPRPTLLGLTYEDILGGGQPAGDPKPPLAPSLLPGMASGTPPADTAAARVPAPAPERSTTGRASTVVPDRPPAERPLAPVAAARPAEAPRTAESTARSGPSLTTSFSSGGASITHIGTSTSATGEPAAGGASAAGGTPSTGSTPATAGTAALGTFWTDLRRAAPLRTSRPRPLMAWPTQFGPTDHPTAALPPGMGVPYQRVLVPGEADAMLSGQITTVRGLVHPLAHVRELTTPAELFDALGLGFTINEHTTPSAAFDRRADCLDVLRFAGVRDRDLIVPLDAGVRHAGPIRGVLRDHARPWTGTGSAPGSTSSHPIDEFEILGTRSLAVPHLAELWRVHSLGPDQHLATWDARSATWLGPAGGQPQAALAGRPAENGSYARLADGTTFRADVLTDRHTVLVAHGAQAPAHFARGTDGSQRLVVPAESVVRWIEVTSRAVWRGPVHCPVHILRRAGDFVLVEYAGDTREPAGAAGFDQLAQGTWVARWVPWRETVERHEEVAEYPNLILVP